MTPGYITRAVRERVRAEAHNRCGYCLAPQSLAYDTLEIDHIIPEAIGGGNDRDNLWLACRPCNRNKGANTRARDPLTGQMVRLFDPRRDQWQDHFAWSDDGCVIIGQTACGRATVQALHVNNAFAVETRRFWVQAGWRPASG